MPRLIAVVTGCNYEDSPTGWPVLRGAEHDALQMATLLQEPDLPPGFLGGLTLLRGRMATKHMLRATIEQALAAVQSPEDNLFFYFSGHGQITPAGLALCLWDAEYSGAELLQQVGLPGNPTALVFDCCHAAAFLPELHATPATAGNPHPGNTGVLDQALYATRAEGLALEEQGHGIFTTALLETLRALGATTSLALPLDLQAWAAALPAHLHSQGVEMQSGQNAVAHIRGAAVPAGAPSPDLPNAMATAVYTEAAPGAGDASR